MGKSPVNKVSLTQLSTIKIFSGLSDDVKQDVANRLQLKSFSRGETVIEHGDESFEAYFVIGGSVRVTFYSTNGRQVTFRDLGPGSMFGELSALDSQPRSTHVVAAENSALAWIEQAEFLKLLSDHGEIGGRVMRDMAGNIRTLTERVVEFSTSSVKIRVRAELLRLAQSDGNPATVQNIVKAVTHEDIASRISTHREAVTREISDLVSAGVLEKNKRNIIIKNPDELRRLLLGA